MKLLFTIPHFFRDAADPTAGRRKHGSLARDPRPRVEALTACLAALWQLYGKPQCVIDQKRRRTVPANAPLCHEVDVVVCTTGGRHLLGQLPADAAPYQHHPTAAEPLLLGFECQAVLRDRLGGYDYYCYLEDDLILRDPWFFVKLAWFTASAGDGRLLQPNRYEVGQSPLARKAYVDGDLKPQVTAPFQDVRDCPQATGTALGVSVVFRRPLNPHSGCYFLNARQMEHWAAQDHFLDRDTRFIGPLESAATLGIMRTFKVYKPAAEHASFLEIEHHGTGFLNLIRPGGG